MNNLAQTLKAEKDLPGAKQASGAPSSQPSTQRGGTGRFRMISNFRKLCGSFFRGSARLRSKKTP
jgi:hypothetical protein